MKVTLNIILIIGLFYGCESKKSSSDSTVVKEEIKTVETKADTLEKKVEKVELKLSFIRTLRYTGPILFF